MRSNRDTGITIVTFLIILYHPSAITMWRLYMYILTAQNKVSVFRVHACLYADRLATYHVRIDNSSFGV